MWEAKGREGRKGREPEIEWANASVTSKQVDSGTTGQSTMA
jgi:hypothetical protein